MTSRSRWSASRPSRSASEPAYSRMIARTASTCWSISASGMRVGVGRVLDQPAQAVGDGCDQREAEGRGLALDVVGGVKQRRRGSAW